MSIWELLLYRVRDLGWEDPLEKEMATHSSILAWEIPWTEEPGGLQSMGSQRVGHDRVHTHKLHYLNFQYIPSCSKSKQIKRDSGLELGTTLWTLSWKADCLWLPVKWGRSALPSFFIPVPPSHFFSPQQRDALL